MMIEQKTSGLFSVCQLSETQQNATKSGSIDSIETNIAPAAKGRKLAVFRRDTGFGDREWLKLIND